MKFTTPVLLVSLAANVALAAIMYRSHFLAPKGSDRSDRSVRSVGSTSKAKPAAVDAAAVTGAAGEIAALEAAGFTPDIARQIFLGRVFARFADRLRAARDAAGSDDRWWRNRSLATSRLEETQARRELSEALLAAFGDDFGVGGNDTQLSFLSPEKRAALRRITQDYDDMIAKFSAGGLQLASDREKLQLLRAERQRDIAAVLTPAELAEYEMRTSTIAAQLRARYGDAIATDEDFRKLYALQKAFDDRYPMPSGRITPETMRERATAQRQLQADMKAALGEAAYTALTRAADPDLRTVDSLASRLNLPAGTTDQIAALRDSFAAESQRISADTSLTPQQRRAQIQELSTRAKSTLASTLGSEAADAYAPRSPWLNMLQGGMAYSTTPPADSMMGAMPGGPGVYPVMPPGGPGMAGAAVRQIVNMGGGADPTMTAAAPASDMMFYSIGTTAVEPGRVVTFDAVNVDPQMRINAAGAATGGVFITTPMGAAPAPVQGTPPANSQPVVAPKR